MDIREARTPEEIGAAGRVVGAAYRALDFTEEDYLRRVSDARDRAEQATLLVAVEADAVLGSVTYARGGQPYAQIARPDESEFRMLGVDPAAGGRGVGVALVRACIDRARADGATAVVLCTTDMMRAARSIYLRLGFVADPSRDWQPEPNVTLLAFVLDLRQPDRGDAAPR